MLGIGAIGFVAIVVSAMENDSPLGLWILSEVLAPQRTLPVVALGVAFGLTTLRSRTAGFLLFCLGIVAGFVGQYWLLWLLDTIPQAATHLYLTNPLCYLASGIALVMPGKMRGGAVPIAAAIFGALSALLIQMTDPSLHAPAFTAAPIVIALWILAAAAFIIGALWRNWFPIFGRILGSWMLAIGLLYGGASLVPPRNPPIAPAPPVAAPPFDNVIPGLPIPEQPGSIPGMNDRRRQP